MAAELIFASVTTVLKEVYDEAEQASENKEALMNLARKARDVLAPQLAVMQTKIKGSKADHVLPALTFLDTCLRNVSALIKKRGKKRAECSCLWTPSNAGLLRLRQKSKGQRVIFFKLYK